jgi:hypothetical protein
LIQTGTTEDGRIVVGNVFKLSDTHGVPLEIILDVFERKGIVIDWIEYTKDCIKSGWKLDTIIRKVEYPLADVHGNEYANEVITRIKQWVGNSVG